jgi:hypothetical protein
MTDHPLSDLSLKRTECAKCGAVWLNGKHVWATGASSDHSELDLAGLVCNKLGNEQCVNPKKGIEGGITWEKRMEEMEKLTYLTE